jgi:hypothetical protein
MRCGWGQLRRTGLGIGGLDHLQVPMVGRQTTGAGRPGPAKPFHADAPRSSAEGGREGWRVLRLQAAPGCRCSDRASSVVDHRHRSRCRRSRRRIPSRPAGRRRHQAIRVHRRQGLRRGPVLRRVRGSGHASRCSPSGDAVRQGWQGRPSVARARGLDFRRLRCEARGGQVPLPDCDCTRRRLDQGDRLHTLIPRETDRWKAIYKTRVSVERTFGRLKHVRRGNDLYRFRGQTLGVGGSETSP